MTDTTARKPDPEAGDQSPVKRVLPPAKQPVGSGFTPAVAIVVAVCVGAIGVVGVQEALVRSRVIDGPAWVTQLLAKLNHQEASFGTLVASVALVLIGVWLLSLVLRRRPRKSIGLAAQTGVFLRTKDLGGIAAAAVQGADGVTDVDADATRGRVRVTVHTVEPSSSNGELRRRVEERLGGVVDALDPRPRVKIEIDNQELA